MSRRRARRGEVEERRRQDETGWKEERAKTICLQRFQKVH